MATITRLYGWESGNVMVAHSDMSEVNLALINYSATYAKTGAYSLGMRAGAPVWTRYAYPAGISNPSVSVWIHPINVYAGTFRLRFLLSTGEYIDLRWNTGTKCMDAYVNNSLVSSGTVPVTVSTTWFHVQFNTVIADAGSIGSKINGSTDIDYSGDTQPGAAATCTYLYLYSDSGLSYIYFDDLAIGYGGFLGDIRCIDIRPNADTAVDDWTPSAGDNYATIDETPPSDADYNETNVDAQADELALGDFDGVTYNPVAVTAWVRARMEAATGDSIKVGIDSGGTDDVTESPLSTSWAYYFHTADQNPADAAEWEDADIDALLLRYESVIA